MQPAVIQDPIEKGLLVYQHLSLGPLNPCVLETGRCPLDVVKQPENFSDPMETFDVFPGQSVTGSPQKLKIGSPRRSISGNHGDVRRWGSRAGRFPVDDKEVSIVPGAANAHVLRDEIRTSVQDARTCLFDMRPFVFDGIQVIERPERAWKNP
jgi:hypothetical protein